MKSALAAQSHVPDIIAVEPGAYAVDVSTSGSVLDFAKVFAQDPDYQRGFWPNAIELLTINGAVVSVPAVTNTVIVYYNKGLFAQHGLEVPQTLEELKKVGAALERQGHRAHRLSGRTGPELPHLSLLHVRRRHQGRQAPARGGPRRGSPGRVPELVAAAEFVEMMAKSGLYAPGALGIKEPDAISIFASGKSAMFWGGQWMRRSIRAALPAGLRPRDLSLPRRGGRRARSPCSARWGSPSPSTRAASSPSWPSR